MHSPFNIHTNWLDDLKKVTFSCRNDDAFCKAYKVHPHTLQRRKMCCWIHSAQTQTQTMSTYSFINGAASLSTCAAQTPRLRASTSLADPSAKRHKPRHKQKTLLFPDETLCVLEENQKSKEKNNQEGQAYKVKWGNQSVQENWITDTLKLQG